MRAKVTMIMVMSLDGLVLREEGEDVTKWTSKEDQMYFKNVLANFDAIITGRKSFMGKVVNKPYFVLSKTINKTDPKNQIFYINAKPKEVIKFIQKSNFNNLALLGGTETNMQFLKEGLVDQLLITIEPKLLGVCKHITLAEKLNINLKLVNYHQINNKGTMVLHYLVDKGRKKIKYNNLLDKIPKNVELVDNAQLSNINRDFWDERALLHKNSKFYDTSALIDGRLTLMDYEKKELGDVKSKEIIHLQCHIATESISLAKLGAKVTAVDYSQTSIKVAKKLAEQSNVDIDFICSNVYDILETINNKKYDIVYVNIGALIFLQNLDKWAFIVKKLLKKNGFLYLNELHPVSATLSDYEPKIIFDYFDTSPKIWHENGSYADGIEERVNVKTTHNDLTVWNWTLGDIISAISKEGLKIEFLHEHPKHVDKRFYYLEQDENKLWQPPDEMPKFPATFSLKAQRID